MITGADYYRSTADADAVERSAPRGPFERSAKAVATGHEGDTAQLKKYWLGGEGLAKWATSPHPWTTLYHHLLKYIHNPDFAKRTASQWFHDHFGYWPGDRKGKNPIGRG